MPRGRKPQPTKVKMLRGNPGRRKLNDREPQGDVLPPCPDHLTGAARQAWDDFASGLDGIATSLDATALELLASAYAAFLDAAAKVVQGGPVWIKKTEPGELPSFVYSPYWAVTNREWKKIKEMLTEFGMTPSSRSRLQAIPSGDGDELDQFVKSKIAG